MINFKRFPGQEWPIVLFGFISVFWGNFGQSFFVGVYGESFKSTLNLSASQYGSLYSLATFIAGFVFLFVGVWIDKLSLRTFAIIAGLGLACACVFLGLSENIFILFFGLFFVRLFGQSLMPHTGLITMARAFDKNRGKALGAAASAVPVGEIVLPMLAIYLILKLGWQQTWFFYAAIVLLVYIPLAILLLKKRGLEEKDSPEMENVVASISGRFSLLKIPQFWLILPSILLGPFVVTGVFIHQDYLLQVKAWSSTVWVSSFIAYGIVHWLSSIAVGVLIDRFSAKKLLAWYNLPIVTSMFVLLLGNFTFSVGIFLSLLGIAIGFGGPLSSALWAELYGKKHLGGIRSMVTAFSVVATAMSPVLLGLAIDANISLEKIAGMTMGLGVLVAILSRFAFSKVTD